MYQILYKTIKPKYGIKAEVFHSNTDSSLLVFEIGDLCNDFELIQEEIDSSNYPGDHLRDRNNPVSQSNIFVEECDSIDHSSADDERYLAMGIEELAFGHYKTPQHK